MKMGKPCVIMEIKNYYPEIFRALTNSKPDSYSEPSQKLKMAYFAKIVKSYNYFSKTLNLRSLTGFNKHSISTH